MGNVCLGSLLAGAGEQASISPQHLCLSLFPPARWVLQKGRLIRRETRPGVQGCAAKAEPRGGDKKLAGERVTRLRAAAVLGPRPCVGGSSRKQTHLLEKARDGAWGKEATQEPAAPCPLHASSLSGPQRSLGSGGCGPEAGGSCSTGPHSYAAGNSCSPNMRRPRLVPKPPPS